MTLATTMRPRSQLYMVITVYNVLIIGFGVTKKTLTVTCYSSPIETQCPFHVPCAFPFDSPFGGSILLKSPPYRWPTFHTAGLLKGF